jgi:predicted nucleotidyltransferase
MVYQLAFPTPLHAAAAEAAYQFFQPKPAVDTVLLVNSLARGQGIPESDLDMAVMVRAGTPAEEVARLDALWQQERFANDTLRRFHASGVHAHLHLDVISGDYQPQVWDDGGGPDGFELEIGNQLVYAAPLHAVGPTYRALQARWLPYYPSELRSQRLAMAREACVGWGI